MPMVPRRHRVWAAFASAAVAIAAFGAITQPGSAQNAPSRASRLPGCSKEVAIHLASTVIAAFNRGDARTIDRVVAPEPAFEWFSTRSRLGLESRDRSTLASYVRLRHRHHERWIPVSLWPLRLTHVADDMRRTTRNGKFDTICARGHTWIFVWSV